MTGEDYASTLASAKSCSDGCSALPNFDTGSKWGRGIELEFYSGNGWCYCLYEKNRLPNLSAAQMAQYRVASLYPAWTSPLGSGPVQSFDYDPDGLCWALNPTTPSPTTPSPTTPLPTTPQPTTASPTTPLPTTPQPTTANPTTAIPTTASPTTALPTTSSPTTYSPTTASPTTASPTTASPTTASPTPPVSHTNAFESWVF